MAHYSEKPFVAFSFRLVSPTIWTLCNHIKTLLIVFAVFTSASTAPPHSRRNNVRRGWLRCAGTGHIHMTAYRITERGSRFIIGTEREALLICRSLDVAHQAVADAELLEILPAKLIFARRVTRKAEEAET